MALTGDEIVYVTGLDAQGRAAATQFPTTVQDIADLAVVGPEVEEVVFEGSVSGTTTLQASAAAGTTTITLPAATDTLVGKATTDTLTNKTLTAPTLGGTVAGTYTLGGTPTVGVDTTLADGVDLILNATTGTKIGTGATQKLGFWNATPVVQQATTGTTTGFTAGAGTAVLSDSTFTGNSGTKAYTIGDIVLALKNTGILAAS